MFKNKFFYSFENQNVYTSSKYSISNIRTKILIFARNNNYI